MSKKATLYFIFSMPDNKTRKLSISDARADLTKAEIEAVGNAIAEKKAFVYKGVPVGALKDWYVENVSQDRPQ